MLQRISRLRSIVKDFGLSTSLLSGNKDYTKFVVLGMGRTGSNMLASALRSHPNIIVHGELFNANPRKLSLQKLPGVYTTNQLLSLRNTNPGQYLDTAVFKTLPSSVSAVGFKIFYYHADNPEWQAVWAHLKDQGVCAIHIKRRNLLKLFLSTKVAQATSQWSVSSSLENREQPSLTLNFNECKKSFEEIHNWYGQYDAYFGNTHEIFYEDLVTEFSNGMNKIQQFLGVSPQSVHPLTQKQARLPLSQSISNYEELERMFRDTQWNVFFE